MTRGRKHASDLTLRPIEESEQAIVYRLVDDYFAELAAYEERPVGPVCAADDPYLPLYWTEPTRHPFFIELSGRVVGFALVRVVSERSAEVAELAEFYIRPIWRRQRLGRRAAIAVWSRFPGRWKLQVSVNNQAAEAFWSSSIEAVASGCVSREEFEGPDGPRIWYGFAVGAAA